MLSFTAYMLLGLSPLICVLLFYICFALSLHMIFHEIKSFKRSHMGSLRHNTSCCTYDTFAVLLALSILFIQFCGKELLCSQNTLYRSCTLFTTHFTSSHVFPFFSVTLFISLIHWLHLSRSICSSPFGFHTAHYREVLLQRQQQSENFIKNLLMRPHSCGTLFTQWWSLSLQWGRQALTLW